MERIVEVEELLGYQFKKQDLIRTALTHKSYVNENPELGLEHNEKLEFLGDAVLELAISDLLMLRFPHLREGDLSKLRAAIVNETCLADMAKRIHLGKYLWVGKGEETTRGREKPSLLADAYEAILGAIYLDSGFPEGFVVVNKHFGHLIERASSEDISGDYKTALQEHVQKLFKQTPRYKVIEEVGPDHAKIFTIQLTVGDKITTEGTGKSKKEAEQNAALNALGIILSIEEREEENADL